MRVPQPVTSRLRPGAWTGLFLALLAAAPAAPACVAREPTPRAALGPHDFSTAPASNELWRPGDGGEPLILHLRVLDTCSEPVPGAFVHLLHADHDGEHYAHRGRALLQADQRGVVELITVVPGYAGDLARHIHFIVRHPGHHELVTRLYFRNDPALGGDGPEGLTLSLEEIRHRGEKRWVSGFEFVLAPRAP